MLDASKPVLYLDFDHVLNNSAWFHSEARNQIWKEKKSPLERARGDILPEYAKLVARLIQEVGAQVIVCSNWRIHFSDVQLEGILAEHGIPFHGATRRPRFSEYRDIRVIAIREHQRTLPPGTRWCVLDDMVSPKEVGGHGVQPEDGATPEDLAQVKKILLGEL